MKIALLVFITLFVASANGADASQAVDLETAVSAENTPLLRAPMSAGLVQRAHTLLETDYEQNLRDLIRTRWFFRKTANFSEDYYDPNLNFVFEVQK